VRFKSQIAGIQAFILVELFEVLGLKVRYFENELFRRKHLHISKD